MNKKAQVNMDWEEIIKFIIIVPILIALFGAIFVGLSSFNKQCPTCDCSSYQTNLSTCSGLVNNLTKQLNETPIKYVNVTVDKPVYIDKPIYRDTPVSITIISITFILSLVLTIKLFKLEIKLPKEIEDKINKIEKVILTIKIISAIISVLILIKLILILISLF